MLRGWECRCLSALLEGRRDKQFAKGFDGKIGHGIGILLQLNTAQHGLHAVRRFGRFEHFVNLFIVQLDTSSENLKNVPHPRATPPDHSDGVAHCPTCASWSSSVAVDCSSSSSSGTDWIDSNHLPLHRPVYRAIWIILCLVKLFDMVKLTSCDAPTMQKWPVQGRFSSGWLGYAPQDQRSTYWRGERCAGRRGSLRKCPLNY